MKTKQTVPANLPANAIGFFAPHLRYADRLTLYRPDGTPSNTYPTGMTLAQIGAEFGFTPGSISVEGFLVK